MIWNTELDGQQTIQEKLKYAFWLKSTALVFSGMDHVSQESESFKNQMVIIQEYMSTIVSVSALEQEAILTSTYMFLVTDQVQLDIIFSQMICCVQLYTFKHTLNIGHI